MTDTLINADNKFAPISVKRVTRHARVYPWSKLCVYAITWPMDKHSYSAYSATGALWRIRSDMFRISVNYLKQYSSAQPIYVWRGHGHNYIPYRAHNCRLYFNSKNVAL